MKLSIITINYNNRDGLQRTINSVLSQTYKDYEWIVIDGGSTDGSKELLELNKNRFSYWCSERDGGVYNAMNKGIKVSKGEFLNFMNSGDEYKDEFTLESLFSNPHYGDILYGNVLRIRQDGTSYLRTFPNPLSLDYFVGQCTISHQASFIKGDVHRSNMYDESFKICSDLKFFMHALIQGYKFEYIDSTLAKFYEGGISSTDILRTWDEGRKIVEDELSAKYLPTPFNSLLRSYYKRRLFKRMITLFAKILEIF